MQQQLAAELSPSPLLLSNLYQVYIIPVPDLPLGGSCRPGRDLCALCSLGTVFAGGPDRSWALLAESRAVLLCLFMGFTVLWRKNTCPEATGLLQFPKVA